MALLLGNEVAIVITYPAGQLKQATSCAKALRSQTAIRELFVLQSVLGERRKLRCLPDKKQWLNKTLRPTSVCILDV
jgi:hypothetical protein